MWLLGAPFAAGGNPVAIKKKLELAGIYVTSNDDAGDDIRQVRRHYYAGHALRGNAESTIDYGLTQSA